MFTLLRKQTLKSIAFELFAVFIISRGSVAIVCNKDIAQDSRPDKPLNVIHLIPQLAWHNHQTKQ
jgi:hypothetical protein